MAVAVAESKLPFSDKPSTSFAGAIKLVSSLVLSFSMIGSCKMIPEISESSLAERILFLISSEFLAR